MQVSKSKPKKISILCTFKWVHLFDPIYMYTVCIWFSIYKLKQRNIILVDRCARGGFKILSV